MKEYLIQGLKNGIVEDALTAYGLESAKAKAKSGWASWFDELRVYDISDPLNPSVVVLQ